MTEKHFDIAFSTEEIMREAAGPTTASKTQLKRTARYLKGRQRICTEFPLGRQVGRRHPCDGGCRLGQRPEDKVLNVWRSIGNWPVLHGTTLVCDTGNSIAVRNQVRGQGDNERLHGSVVRETLAGTPDCTTVQNLSLDGQQQRQSHHATARTREQSKTFGGAGDVGSHS